MTAPASIPVVCALIERDGRILLAQRPRDKHLPLKWEFPGGKTETEEEPARAIVREIHEELGCAIVVTRALPRIIHQYERATIEMIAFVARLEAGSPEPHPHEHVALAWVKPEDLLEYDLAAADLPVVANFRASQTRTPGSE